MEKYNEIQLIKNKMNLNNREMKNHPPSPTLVHTIEINSNLKLTKNCFTKTYI